jgi:hypothetical protein
LKRLAAEAGRRFEQDSLIATTSSLAAMTSVLDPLLGYLQRTWVAEEVAADTDLQPEASEPIGLYL